MYDFLRENQLNIMLLLCGACGILTLLLLNTRFLARRRKVILIFMEVIAFFLLWFDRLAYIYAGDPSTKGYYMVRISNFFVFFLTSAIVLGFNNYLIYMITGEKKDHVPLRLNIVSALSAAGMLLAIISAFTGLYYYFDELNTYHRGNGFLIAYIIPVAGPLIQFSVILKYRKRFSKLIYISVLLYIFVPIIFGVLQIFFYGVSIVNMAMVAVSISLYIFTYLDINNTVENAHQIEILDMQGEKRRMQRLFDQTANAFVSAVELKDSYLKGSYTKVAEYARKIAREYGKNEEECDKIFYTALLHDVGLIGVTDSVIETEKQGEASPEMKKMPLIGKDILSSITEYPYLSQGAYYSHENYDGSGYPDGLKGDEIPEAARIIAVADAYVNISSDRRDHDAGPAFVAREMLLREAGEKLDPVFAELLVKILDAENRGKNSVEAAELETELECDEYRDHISVGIPVESEVIRIMFDTVENKENPEQFSSPALVLFDSYDRRIHNSEKTISEYGYLEFGEIWFDDHMIISGARKAERTLFLRREDAKDGEKENSYDILASRYEDHIRLVMTGPVFNKEVVVALTDGSKSAYIGITGEHCKIKNIKVEATGDKVKEGDITRIAEKVVYTDHLESDIRNIQIDRNRSAYTEGVALAGKMKIVFHTMSLPGANLVWHCPYIVLYHSADGKVNGPDYQEYAFIKLNGENEGSEESGHNRFVMKRKDEFPGWDNWKKRNREGMECELSFVRAGDKLTLKTENLGIFIENTLTLPDTTGKVYAALTGDQVVLTDIRVRGAGRG